MSVNIKEYINISSSKFKTHIALNFVLTLFLLVLISSLSYGQSTANWLYPDGNMQATRYQPVRSAPQSIDSITVKWATGLISGEVKPLIGDIVPNNLLFNGGELNLQPNEIVAIIGDEIVMYDGLGKLIKRHNLPNFVKGFGDISFMFDTLSTGADYVPRRNLVFALESFEYQPEDSILNSYIFGYDSRIDSLIIMARMGIPLQQYNPNVFGSLRPVFYMKDGNQMYVYATVNMTQPVIPSSHLEYSSPAPYYRGLTQFNFGTTFKKEILPEVKEDLYAKMTLAPEINVSQPSISMVNGRNTIYLPSFPSPILGDVAIKNENGLLGDYTFPPDPYVFAYNFLDNSIYEELSPINMYFLKNQENQRPRIRPFSVDIINPQTNEQGFILVAEEYYGLEGSEGTAKLHLYSKEGIELTSTDFGATFEPAFVGGRNHLWSVAVGNVDGDTTNSWLPYYPNNPGNEIIVTQSTREFAFPGSKLSILRYNTRDIEKPTSAGNFLHPFDTIATQKINGWVAAVNDFDGDPDRKDEIVLVNGSELMIVRLRDYDDIRFRLGMPFDTVFTHSFVNQTITNVAIADMEGDGRNDLIVTTNDSTYMMGMSIGNTIAILRPIQEGQNYCVGDTLHIHWYNVINRLADLEIRFVPFENGDYNYSADTVLISAIRNDKDTMRVHYIVDEKLMGRSGKLVIQAEDRTTLLYAESPILHFGEAQIGLYQVPDRSYYVGELFNINGWTACVEEVTVEYFSITDSTWIFIESRGVEDDGTFSIMVEVPCLDIFNCSEEDLSDRIDVRVIGQKDRFSDTTSVFSVLVKPSPFEVYWERPSTADPLIKFYWSNIQKKYSCDTIDLLISFDNLKTFSYITTLLSVNEQFDWIVPLETPDSLYFRFCCRSSCIRTDTLIVNYKPRYINIIAPNPFSPIYEQAEIVYKVPEETNVSLRIFDQGNKMVAELIKDAPRLPGYAYVLSGFGNFAGCTRNSPNLH